MGTSAALRDSTRDYAADISFGLNVTAVLLEVRDVASNVLENFEGGILVL